MHWEARMRDLAATQLGLVGRRHLDEIDASKEQWYRARRSGRWTSLSDRVVLLTGTALTDEVRALAGVLDAAPGAALHWRSALAWYGMAGFDLRQILVSRPRHLGLKPVTLAEVHRLRALRDHDVTIFRGVPTQRPLRAIWSEAARYSAPHRADLGMARIGRLLDNAHRDGLVGWQELRSIVEDIHQRGRAGTVLMRALSADRPPGSSPTESRNEDRLEEILRDRGMATLRRQVVLGGTDAIGRSDFRDPDRPLAVEVNSEKYHTTPSDRAADEVRYRRLNDVGFFVGVVWENDLWRNPTGAAGTIREARRRAKADELDVLHSPGCPWPPPLLGSVWCD